MSSNQNKALFIARRAELLAELFLQEMEPSYLAKPNSDFGYDFFIGLPNQSGGVNTFVVEVKATDKKVGSSFGVSPRTHHRLAYSNVPALLLVVDVKLNKIYIGWPSPKDAENADSTQQVKVPVQEAESDTPALIKAEILKHPQNMAMVNQ